MKKYIKILAIGILLIVGMNSCSTLGPPPDGPNMVYYTYPSYYYYRPAPIPRYYLPKYGYFDKNSHYRPVPPPPRPKPNTPPRPNNNGNRRHR